METLDNDYFENCLNELNEIANKLEAAAENTNLTSEATLNSNIQNLHYNAEGSKSLQKDQSISTNLCYEEMQIPSLPVEPLIAGISQCSGNNLQSSISDYHASFSQGISKATENKIATLVFGERMQEEFLQKDDSLSDPSAYISFENDSEYCNMTPMPNRYLKSIGYEISHSTYIDEDGNSSGSSFRRNSIFFDSATSFLPSGARDNEKNEAQNRKDYEQSEICSSKITQCDSRRMSDSIKRDERFENSSGLVEGNLSALVAGPFGILTQSEGKDAKKGFICDACEKRIVKKSDKYEHLRTHTCKTPFKSVTVDKSLEKVQFKKQPLAMIAEKTSICDICKKAFVQKSCLERYQLTHTGGNPFACEICGKIFSQITTLNTHLLTHSKENPFACEKCNKGFSEKSKLDIHLRTHTGEKPFACEICGKRFSRKDNLNYHLRTHSKEKPFACEKCDKRFSRKDHLNYHLGTHSKEKPFACEICGKRYSFKSNLNSHLRTHSKEKPFICEICNKGFSKKPILDNHLRTHTGEKPFVCEICGKRFCQISTLNTHLYTHSKEKPFICKICKKGFSTKSNLNYHLGTHSKEKPLACEKCNKG